MLRYGGAISVDGVQLKVQDKHYYDFKLHCIVIRCKGPFENVKFELRNRTILPVEAPDSPSANNIKTNIRSVLNRKYGLSIDLFARAWGLTVLQ